VGSVALRTKFSLKRETSNDEHIQHWRDPCGAFCLFRLHQSSFFLRLPHTIGLVVMALAASLLIIGFDMVQPSVQIGQRVTGVLRQIDFNETLMHGMLSFLLFAGALHADFSYFKARRLTIGVMAVLGTLISTFVVGAVLWLLLGLFDLELPFIWALVFGALISPTYPVAVLSLFKTVKVPDTLQTKMASESLFNDGVGVVVFTVIVAISLAGGEQGDVMGVADIIELFFTEAVGGTVLDLATGYIGYRAMYGIDDPSLEVLITQALVIVTYALALSLHMSGPITMVVAGLFIGNRGVKYAMSLQTREYVLTFWTLIDQILNSVLFLLIGLEVLVIAESSDFLRVALLAIPVTLFARALSHHPYRYLVALGNLRQWRRAGVDLGRASRRDRGRASLVPPRY